MTFSEFKKTPFYTWHENWYYNCPIFEMKEDVEGMMKALYNLSFRDQMMKTFEENPKLYGRIIFTTSLPRLQRGGEYNEVFN